MSLFEPESFRFSTTTKWIFGCWVIFLVVWALAVCSIAVHFLAKFW